MDAENATIRYDKMTLATWQRTIKPLSDMIVQGSPKDGSDSWQEFPIGMGYNYLFCDIRSRELQLGNHENMVFSCINPNTDKVRRPKGINRIMIYNNLMQNGIFTDYYCPTEYFSALPQYKFVISPEGNGIDCHRHYEALMAGCIPIIERNPLIEEKYRGCPILYTIDYSEITEEFLNQQYIKMLNMEYDFSRLFLSFYSNEQITEIKDCGNYWTQTLSGRSFY